MRPDAEDIVHVPYHVRDSLSAQVPSGLQRFGLLLWWLDCASTSCRLGLLADHPSLQCSRTDP